MVLRIEKFVKTKVTIEKKARINTIFFGHNYTYDHFDLFFRSDFYTRQDQCGAVQSLKNQSVAHTQYFLKICYRMRIIIFKKEYFLNRSTLFCRNNFIKTITLSKQEIIPNKYFSFEILKLPLDGMNHTRFAF